MTGEQKYAHSVPRRMHANWARPDDVQKLIVFSTIIATIVTNMTFGKFYAIPVAIAGGVLYAPVVGKMKRPVYYRLSEVVRSYLLRRRGGNIYTVDMKDTVLSFDEESSAFIPKKLNQHRFSTKLIAIPFGNSLLAFYRERVGREDYLVGALVGDGHPRATTGTQAQRFMWDKVYTAALKRGLNVTEEQVDFAQVVMSRPADPTEIEEYADERWHDDFADPAPGSSDARIKTEELEHQDITYSGARQYRLALFVRMRFPRAWRRKDLSTLTPDQVKAAPIIKVLETWRSNLVGGVTNMRYPSLFEMNELGHLLFNSENLNLFFSEQYEDKRRESQGRLASVEDARTLKRGPWPHTVIAGHDALIANQTMHSTLVVTGLESDEMPVGFLDDIYTESDFSFVFSRLVQSFPYTKGMKRSRRKLRFVAAARGFANQGRSDEFDLEGQERETEAGLGHLGLFHSKSRSTQARIHLTVSSAIDREVHQLNLERASTMLRNHGMLNQPYLWAPNQLPPLLSHFCIFDGEE